MKKGITQVWAFGAFLGFFSFFIASAGAQSTAQQPASAKAITELKMRDEPPSKGFVMIKSPGSVIGSIKKGEKVEVLETRTVSTFLSDSVWVRVKKMTDSGKPLEGWVYWGTKKEESVNFNVEKQE